MKELTIITKGAIKNCLFVMLFLALIQPFGIDTVEKGRIPFILAETACAFVSVIIALLLSNVVMRSTIKEESLGKAMVHILVFFLINTPILGAMLLTFVSWFNADNPLLYWFLEDGRFNIWAWGTMCLYVSSVSVIVAFIVIYQVRNDKLLQRLNEVEQMNQRLEARQEEMENEIKTDAKKNNEEETPQAHEEEMIEFIGQGQKSHLEVPAQSIIYVESMANYADICYISDNEIHHSTLRITLKQVREALAHIDSIVQCHRAFLVNINFIQKITDRNSGYQLQLFGLEKQIPVSRANESIIKEKLG